MIIKLQILNKTTNIHLKIIIQNPCCPVSELNIKHWHKHGIYNYSSQGTINTSFQKPAQNEKEEDGLKS